MVGYRGRLVYSPAILEKELERIREEERINDRRWRTIAASQLVHLANVGREYSRNDLFKLIDTRSNALNKRRKR